MSKNRLTHFLAIPLNTPAFQQHLNNTVYPWIRSKVDSQSWYTPDLLQPPVRTHFTLQVLHLPSASHIAKVKHILQHVPKQLLPTQTVSFSKFSAFCNGTSHSKTRILYLDLDDTSMVQPLIDYLKQELCKQGLITPEEASEPTTLHATIMGPKFIKNNVKNLRHFDATHILNAPYPELASCAVSLSSVQLLQMRGDPSNGYYMLEHQI